MERFLVYSTHTGSEPPQCFVIEAPSKEAIAAAYPILATQPMYRFPDERPDWLNDTYLAVLEAGEPHRLGNPEPRGLATLLAHLANGDVWRRYALEERPPGEAPRVHGELGTFRELGVGSDVGGLPRKSARWRVAAIEPATHAEVAATLVIEPFNES